jgi:hypothetical protein
MNTYMGQLHVIRREGREGEKARLRTFKLSDSSSLSVSLWASPISDSVSFPPPSVPDALPLVVADAEVGVDCWFFFAFAFSLFS